MVSPLLLLLKWLEQEKYRKEMNDLSKYILRYFPGYKNTDDEQGTVPDLIRFCKKESSAPKIYGMFLFIHAYIKNYFKWKTGVVDLPISKGLRISPDKNSLEIKKAGLS